MWRLSTILTISAKLYYITGRQWRLTVILALFPGHSHHQFLIACKNGKGRALTYHSSTCIWQLYYTAAGKHLCWLSIRLCSCSLVSCFYRLDRRPESCIFVQYPLSTEPLCDSTLSVVLNPLVRCLFSSSAQMQIINVAIISLELWVLMQRECNHLVPRVDPPAQVAAEVPFATMLDAV